VPRRTVDWYIGADVREVCLLRLKGYLHRLPWTWTRQILPKRRCLHTSTYRVISEDKRPCPQRLQVFYFTTKVNILFIRYFYVKIWTALPSILFIKLTSLTNILTNNEKKSEFFTKQEFSNFFITNLMHKILIYLYIIHLLKFSTCFEHYSAHLQEVYFVIVYMQPLVSSLSAGDCLVHRLRMNFFLNRCTRQSPAESDDTTDCIYTITT
jgi:hypothetical protein